MSPHADDLGDVALARRLDAALDAGLDGPVDTTSLLAGARGGARRIRRRRRAGAAVLTVLAVAAAPTGYELLQPNPAAAPRQVASAPPAPATGAEASLFAAPEGPSPSPSTTVTLVSLAAPKSFPGSIAFEPADLDRPLQKTLDPGNGPDIPPVNGQACGSRGPSPSAGRYWAWTEDTSNSHDQVTVNLTVTGWADGGGSLAIKDVATDQGRCQFEQPVQEAPLDDLPVDGGWAGTSQSAEGNVHFGYAVVELGDVLIAVSVTHPDGSAAALAEAKRLVAIAAERTVVALS